MMFTNRVKSAMTLAAAGVVGLVLAPANAFAATATATFQVSASVSAYCTASASDMAFNGYNGTASVPANSTISVTCTNGTQYQVGLSGGASNNVNGRTLKNGSNTLAYGLYRDAAFTKNWGNTPGTDTPDAVTGNGTAQAMTVYGNLPAVATLPAPGTYTDSITATITY